MNLFNSTLPKLSPQRQAIVDAYHCDEKSRVEALIASLHFSAEDKRVIERTASDLVNTVRAEKSDQSSVDALMAEYDLSSAEGIVLMCLAEALLRIPDKATEELFIKDKLNNADWEKHIGESESLFVNLATRGLSLSSTMLADQSQSNLFKKIWYGVVGRRSEE